VATFVSIAGSAIAQTSRVGEGDATVTPAAWQDQAPRVNRRRGSLAGLAMLSSGIDVGHGPSGDQVEYDANG
jgi:hypothetical protein